MLTVKPLDPLTFLLLFDYACRSGPTEVLYQNRASTGYYGNVKGRCIGEELLNRLLAVSQEAIAEAFEALIVEQVGTEPVGAQVSCTSLC